MAEQALNWIAWGFFMGIGWALAQWLVGLVTSRLP